jgi:hypothetical protein
VTSPRGQISESRFDDGFGEKFQYDAAQNIAATKTNQPESSNSKIDNKDKASVYTLKLQQTHGGGSTQDISNFTNWQASKGGRVEKSYGAKGEVITLTYDERGRVIKRVVERNGFRAKTWLYEAEFHVEKSKI